MIRFMCNHRLVSADCPGGTTTLSWIRGQLGLKGTKEGCREGDCGACTVLLGRAHQGRIRYRAVCSCLLPVAALRGSHLVTIEGLSPPGERNLTPFQKQFYLNGASQCGFCTPGMIMSLTGFLLGGAEITVDNAIQALDGNICRCTGYASVRRAVEAVVNQIPSEYSSRMEMLVQQGHVPEYFSTIPERLAEITDHSSGSLSSPGCSNEYRIAGGTDLYVKPDSSLINCEPEFFPKNLVPDSITESPDRIAIGAGATVESIMESRVLNTMFPQLRKFLRLVSSTQVRSVATIGGNIMNGSPIADLAVMLLALDAHVHTESETLPLRDFYLGYKQFRIDRGEMIIAFSFRKPGDTAELSLLKVSKRAQLDIASVNSAALLIIRGGTVESATLSAGGVAPFPLLLGKTSGFLKGKEISPVNIQKAQDICSGEIAPISDVRGSKEYKTELLRSMIRAHLTRKSHHEAL